jgi:Rrf2 family protein
MKLGTRTRYATRAMLELALKYTEGTVSAREIASQQHVSPKYLEQLLTSLRSANLVRSVRGAQGGHTLTRHPAQVNLRQIYEAIEGTEGFVACTTCPEVCDRTETCATREIWDQLYAACMEILESTTLEDLARRTSHTQGVQGVAFSANHRS